MDIVYEHCNNYCIREHHIYQDTCIWKPVICMKFWYVHGWLRIWRIDVQWLLWRKKQLLDTCLVRYVSYICSLFIQRGGSIEYTVSEVPCLIKFKAAKKEDVERLKKCIWDTKRNIIINYHLPNCQHFTT